MFRFWSLIIVAAAASVPALVLRFGAGGHPGPGIAALLFGVAILGGAFLLTWGAEVAEMDIAQGLALAFLALVAVLPEYAVDLYFAWTAATHPEYTAYATANMTGANRLLIGIAWPLIIVLNWWRSGERELVLPPTRSVELLFLTLATAYSFVLPVKGTISLLDVVVFVGLFIAYVWRTAHQEHAEPELIGPARAVAALRPTLRRGVVVVFFVFAAAVILASAEPFAEALIHVGRNYNVSEFLLVQWLAPLASEAPEVVIACILVMKGDPQAGMGAMVSSKVNQWTLLVGTLPLVYSLALGRPGALHLDARQAQEILLTSAQSLFAIAVLCNLRLSLVEAALLFALFITQLLLPSSLARHTFCGIYLVLGAVIMVHQRRPFVRLLRTGLRPPSAAPGGG